MLGRLHDATLSVPGEFPSLTAPRSVDIVCIDWRRFCFPDLAQGCTSQLHRSCRRTESIPTSDCPPRSAVRGRSSLRIIEVDLDPDASVCRS